MISTQRVIRESCNGLNNSECVSLLKEETRISVEIQVVPQLEENRRTCKTGHDFQVLSKQNCQIPFKNELKQRVYTTPGPAFMDKR